MSVSYTHLDVYKRQAFAPGRSGLRWELLPDILRLGLPTAVQMAVVNAAYLLMTGMLNQFGTAVAAASGVGLKINTFAGTVSYTHLDVYKRQRLTARPPAANK